MSKWLHFCRKGLTFGVACGLAMLAVTGQAARAGSGNVTIFITEGALTPFSFDFTSPLANPITPGDMNHLLADASGINMGNLNTTLAGLGYDFQFDSLSANANAPGAGGLAKLIMSGQIERTTTTGGNKTIQIDVSQNNYSTTATLLGILNNAATGIFTNAPGGNNQLSTSYFNSNNNQDDTSGIHTTTLNYISTGLNPNAHPGPGEPGSSPPLGVPSTPDFSLTGRLNITLGQSTGADNPTDQFSMSTTVTTAVPEPASIALMGMGLAAVIVGLGRLRRRRAAA
jgi:hypothetical protein